MKILLLGEYSNVHATLAEGLQALGHDVTVVSDGDRWKNYHRDIDLRRRSLGLGGAIRYLTDVVRLWPRLRGFDVVQLINPVFLDFKGERIWPFYKYLRRHNGKVFMGAFGIDYFWVKVGMDGTTFRYSDFHINGKQRYSTFINEMKATWLNGSKGELNLRVADDCDGIIAGLYENYVTYLPSYSGKTTFIPFPINSSAVTPATLYPDASDLSDKPTPIHCFIGIQRGRSEYKGTDIMLRALERLESDYPSLVKMEKAESVPFDTYQKMIGSSHVLLDQLYSYTPAMNALMAMAKGMIIVGGGEPEHYELIGEKELHPIINVQPNEDDVYNQMLSQLVNQPHTIRQRQLDSIQYIHRHHDHIQVARQYEALYTK
ncbi:MAG: glycosyltransferase [Bacteroidaceae bacterium]|nr:glycosyltransferase [Bacteroidaceae bacterium]